MASVTVGHTSLDASTSAKSRSSRHFDFDSIAECVNSTVARLGYLDDDRQARILRQRHGLEDGRSWTLEEVGAKLGVSRERVRQLQAKATRRLVRIASHANPEQVSDCVERLRSFGDRIGESLGSEGFCQALAAGARADELRVSAYIELLGVMIGGDDDERQSLYPVDQCVIRTLAENSGVVSVDDLHNAVQGDPEACEAVVDWPDLDLSMRLELVLHVDVDVDGLCSATERTLLGYSGRDLRLFALTRVLRQEGRPLHFTEIARRARPLLTGRLTMSDRNVHAWMDRYKDRFKWVGPGTYGLADWDIGVREGNLTGDLRPARRRGIGDEIALLLSELKEPLSLSYIEDHVLARFEINRASVYASIVQDAANRFIQMGDDLIALSAWYSGSQTRAMREPTRRVRLTNELRECGKTGSPAQGLRRQ